MHLPDDLVVASEFDPEPSRVETVEAGRVPDASFIMDIGPNSARQFARQLNGCKTIIWNGPMGVFEMPRFSEGTRTVATAIAGQTGVTTVVGGGSTAEGCGGTRPDGAYDPRIHRRRRFIGIPGRTGVAGDCGPAGRVV